MKNIRKIYRSSGGPDMYSLLLSSLEEQIPVSRKDILLAAGLTGTDLPSPNPIWLTPKAAAFPTPLLHCCTTLPATGWATAAPRGCRGSRGPGSPRRQLTCTQWWRPASSHGGCLAPLRQGCGCDVPSSGLSGRRSLAPGSDSCVSAELTLE